MMNNYLLVFAISFVVVIYIIIKATKEDKSSGNDNNDGGGSWKKGKTPPKIDLPPGISWPKGPHKDLKKD